jgi:chaperone BCS1
MLFKRHNVKEGLLAYHSRLDNSRYISCTIQEWLDCKSGTGKYGVLDNCSACDLELGLPVLRIEKLVKNGEEHIDVSKTYQYIAEMFDCDYLLEKKFHRSFTCSTYATFYYRKIYQDIARFLENERTYQERNILYKRGYFLYGRPGDGKTSIIGKLVEEVFRGKALVVYMDNSIIESTMLRALRDYDDLLKVFIFEDFQNVLEEEGKISSILNFLDGENSLPKSIVFATTNYPERIPGNIIDRPSRFDFVMQVGDPCKEDIQVFGQHFLGRDLGDSELSLLSGFSMAAIKEIFLISIMQEMSIVDAVQELRTRSGLASASFRKDNPADSIL